MLISIFLSICAYAYGPDLVVERLQEKSSSIEKIAKSNSLNPFNRVQLQYKNEKGSLSEQEFALVLSPKGFSEMGSYSTFLNKQNHSINLLGEKNRSGSVFRAYDLLIRANLLRRQEPVYAEFEKLLEKSQKYLTQQAQRSRADIKAFLKNGSELEKMQMEIGDFRLMLQEIKDLFADKNLKIDELSTDEIITVGEILEKFEEKSEQTLSFKVLESEFNLLQAEHALIHDQKEKFLDKMKFAMKEEKKVKTFSFELVFNLPFLNAKDLSDSKIISRLAEAEHDFLEGKGMELRKIKKMKSVLLEKNRQLKLIEKNLEIDKSATFLSNQEASTILEIRLMNLKRRLLRESLVAEIQTLFLTFLYESGELSGGNPSLFSRRKS